MARSAMILVLGTVTACNTSAGAGPNNASPEQRATPTKLPHDKRVTASDSHPYFQLDAQELRKLIDNMRGVQLGDDRQKVEALLGKPWSDERVARKENRHFIGRFVTYYVTMQAKDLVNERLDRFILLRFDTDDRLTKVVSKVPGIESRP